MEEKGNRHDYAHTTITAIIFGLTGFAMGFYARPNPEPIKAQERKVNGEDYLILEGKCQTKSLLKKGADGIYVPLSEIEIEEEKARASAKDELKRRIFDPKNTEEDKFAR